jgi:hypothetical protein
MSKLSKDSGGAVNGVTAPDNRRAAGADLRHGFWIQGVTGHEADSVRCQTGMTVNVPHDGGHVMAAGHRSGRDGAAGPPAPNTEIVTPAP